MPAEGRIMVIWDLSIGMCARSNKNVSFTQACDIVRIVVHCDAHDMY
jgi:hypothetical protein